jgi:hypothetical protein
VTVGEIKDALSAVGIVLAWGVAVFGWSNRQSKRRGAAIKEQLRTEINGVGSRVQAAELEVGRLLSSSETLERKVGLMEQDGKHATRKEVALLREDIARTREAIERREDVTQKSFLDVMVRLGELGTKVDILLKLEDRKHD